MNSTLNLFEPSQPRSKKVHNGLIQPFLKWVGGKRQLLPVLRKYIPRDFNRHRYYEPFVGGGALFMDLQPSNATINDANGELTNCYEVIRDNPQELLDSLKKHQNTSEYFYALRELDRKPEFQNLNAVERASRIIYLNKTCYNGLFRVNSQGQFNTPFGDYKNPTYANEVSILALSDYLNESHIEILNVDYEIAVLNARRRDFIYFDPPYDPVSDTASFTGYNLDKFGKKEQKELKSLCDDLTNRGCRVLLSNSDTQFIRDLYNNAEKYTIVEVVANRTVNSVATGRGKVTELLIFNNYDVK
jgi:DNA adenine methylase